MNDKTYNVLFLCTSNSARSIMAEALATTLGCGRFRGFSAGSRPAGVVDPLAIEQVQTLVGYPLQSLRSKSWNEFAMDDAPRMDFIITVCDQAAGEACPIWPGHPITAYWGFEDPAAVQGHAAQKRAAFHKVFHEIRTRVHILANLPLHMLEKNVIRYEITNIGNTAVSPRSGN